MQPYSFSSARELFESAREASKDAERIRRQLLAMEARAGSLGGGSFEPRVASTPNPQRMADAVGAMVDREAALERRQAEDYDLIDLACEVLYGREQDGSGGLWSLVGWRADALALHYLDDLPWSKVAERLCYSESYVKQQARAALDTADGWGIPRVVLGFGAAET